MREAIIIGQFERRLVEMGCPSRRLTEKVRELAEHREDLKQAALEEGLAEAEAESRADAQLGDPILLAENEVTLLRQSSWWGRHPILGFCVLPVVGFIPAITVCWGIFLGLCWLLGRVFGSAYTIDGKAANALCDDLAAFHSFAGPVNAMVMLAAIFAVVVVFCRLARRAAVGMKWMLAACAVCSLISLLDNNSGIQPHAFTIRFGWPPAHWFYPALPLLLAVGMFVNQRRRENRLAWIPMERRPDGLQRVIATQDALRAFFRTPTYWVVAALTFTIAALSVEGITTFCLSRARKAELKSKVWPAERAATLAFLKTRQLATPSSGEETVDLKPYLNGTLNDATGGPDSVKDNNLEKLPAGVHVFGGVFFDVEGRIQLAGVAPANAEKKFPVRVQIPISRKCGRIYLLHGADNLDTLGGKIARLLLHYTDGTTAEIGIIGGEHVLDWWGPIYNTDAGVGGHTTSPDTEIAWVGSNPDIEKEAPNYSLRLYRSAFANPHPELEVASMDYASTLSGAAPFLAGLTTEPPPSTSKRP